MRGRQRRISAALTEFRGGVAAARGAAGLLSASAGSQHDDTRAEVVLLRDDPDNPETARVTADPRLQHVVDRVQLQRARMFGGWLKSGPHRAAAAFGEAAPGTAGDPLETWLGQVGKADGGPPVAQLWRVGVGRVAGLPEAGFPAALPLLDAAHLHVTATPEGRWAAESMVERLLLRVVSHYRPGLVRVHVWDAAQHAGTFPGLYPLTRGGLLTVHAPDGLGVLLEQMADRITRVRTSVLVGGHRSLMELADATAGGERVEPWQVVVLAGIGAPLTDRQELQLQRVARAGLACGIQLILVDLPVQLPAATETVHVTEAVARLSVTGPHVAVELDPPVELNQANRACQNIAAWWADWQSREATFADLLPPADRWGCASSAAGLVAPVGFDDTGEQVLARLDDGSPHALVVGPSGSGKTCLIMALLAALTTRYSPRELELYLLDFKEGVSFAQLAPTPQDPTWLPHARVVGVNINEDREYGMALLQFLADEMRRRAAAAKQHGVTKLEDLRRRDPDGHWPRIVAVVDEFQVLFAGGDKLAKQAAAVLEDVARRGRSQGIHLVLASQDMSGIDVFWGRPGIFEQFVLRIGLPRAQRVMGRLNDAALNLRRWHALVNHESGMAHGNLIARIPNAVDGVFEQVQARLHQPDSTPPVLLDGARAPHVDMLAERATTGQAVLGQTVGVTGWPALASLPAEPGRNLAVIGGHNDAPTILAAAATSLARTTPEAEFTVVALAAPTLAAWTAQQTNTIPAGADQLGDLVGQLKATVTARLADNTTSPPIVLVLFGADAAEQHLDRAGMDQLRAVLRRGPEVGVHVLGWWRSIQRLRAVLTGGATVDDMGVWVALDVHGGELGSLVPGLQTVTWSPRPGRGLWFDRFHHSYPETIIVPALEAP